MSRAVAGEAVAQPRKTLATSASCMGTVFGSLSTQKKIFFSSTLVGGSGRFDAGRRRRRKTLHPSSGEAHEPLSSVTFDPDA